MSSFSLVIKKADRKIRTIITGCILIVNVLFVFAVPVFAQADAGKKDAAVEIVFPIDGRKLTEQQIITIALENNRKLKSLHTSVEIANYRLHSNLIRNPELRISDVSTRYYTDEFDEMRIGLRWRVPDLGELGEAKQQARVQWEERKIEESRYRQQFIANVRKEYADILMYDQLVELAQEKVSKEYERIRIVEQLVDLGSRSVVYFTKAKMWHAESENDLSRVVQNQKLARRKLSSQTGLSEGMPLIMKEWPEVTQDVDTLIKLAVEKRPEMELVRQRIELAEKQKRREHLKLIPWPNFIDVSYHIEKKRNKDWGEFMTGIALPLFNWNCGTIKATSLAVKKKQEEFDAAGESIEEEVRSAYIAYENALLDWKDFRKSAEALIADAENVVTQAKEYQTLMPDEVIEMELTVIDTNKLMIEKRRDLAHAFIDLYCAIGIENAEEYLQ